MRNCIIRDLDCLRDTTAPMDCVNAIKLAKSGEWSKSWIIECLVDSDGSAPILKECIRFKNVKTEFLADDLISIYDNEGPMNI